MTLSILGNCIGGIGLFLLGMQLMTDGLKIAAGKTLRTILERSTATPFRGILSGVFITSLVQSSSAVTVATIGFVNAGLMDLLQAVTVIYGSNIGTTMTGWLVSLVGFKFDIKIFALPLIGLGMFLRLTKGNGRSGALGETFAGFGVFFLGIDLLRATFAETGINLPLTLLDGGVGSYFTFLVIGVLLTVAMQSSSAAIAITLTATAGGVIPFDSGASLVIGANIGSTSTAALAALGATPNAKRVATAHVIFNLVTGAVALLLLPFLLHALTVFPQILHAQTNATMLLALFHTVFNILGVGLMLPFTQFMVTRLTGWFRSHEEDEAQPLFLDTNIAATPLLAFHALAKEIERIGNIARRMAKGAISSEAGPSLQLDTDRRTLLKLEIEVGNFINLIRRGNLPEELDHVLPNALRVTSYYREVADVSLRIAQMQQQSRLLANTALAQEIGLYKQHVVKLLDLTDVAREEYAPEECAALFKETEEMYRHLKSSLLKAGTKNLLPVGLMVSLIDLMSDVRRIADQIEKGARYLTTLTTAMPTEDKAIPAQAAA
ncbi:MAG: Na/Pi cotransporter family protein [Deltaproteobacteria bacterium]|jgi:phosphate:Na+ symporter|uniref:Na/Pi cotransporter family protein n=1 Tax=Hydrosulfovibrio ferrireducens TaxID=2934181 RepID=UPI00121E0FF5|nr:MAG: Na/Pi cotransporter family protein [Deltaproteobacteria bacterium]